MTAARALGDLIGGRFAGASGTPMSSRNPARDGAVVLETAWDARHAHLACDAAAGALPAWSKRSLASRWEALQRFHEALAERAVALADAVVAETGKLRSEARAEVTTVLGRFALAYRMAGELAGEGVPGHPHERLRYQPLGVVAVIGPGNFPLHLCHAYALPALLLGCTVVVKPSEATPLCGQRYAEAALAAGLPPGVLNVVQGPGAVGEALVADPHLRGLWFTGTYGTGRRIQELALDRPELLVALEMGGKNAAVVFEDADLRQAAHDLVAGGYLTTGQRCTATERVLVARERATELVEALRGIVERLAFGDPESPASFAGPLAGEAARSRFLDGMAHAEASGAAALLRSRSRPGGAYVTPALHRLPDGLHHLPGYTDTEMFGPDLSVETFDTGEEALEVLRTNPYGLVNSVFTADRRRFEAFLHAGLAGGVNWNRGTNQASPRLPFGGVGRSGNYRPGGSHAGRSLVFPVAVQEQEVGAVAAPHPALDRMLPPPDLGRLEQRHEREEVAEAARDLLDTPRPQRLLRPAGGVLPDSERWLRRLYAGRRVPEEKKPLVVDHLRSAGPWLVSVDAEPLSVLDTMSQTATQPCGLTADAVARAYVEGEFAGTVLSASDGAADDPEAEAFAEALRRLAPGLPAVSWANSGAEANEKALALCAADSKRPGATGVLAFEGSFHGRTLLALHATWSPAKREPFELPGYEVTFAPFPVWRDPSPEAPPEPDGLLALAAAGDHEGLAARFGDTPDPLLRAEVASLAVAGRALAGGRLFACIVEPMQCEGGDRYATPRFFRALRLLTRAHEVPLVFDEVQTGFGLGGPFLWHSSFELVTGDGQPDTPDAVTLGKRAQVGVCLSRFADPEPTATHPASLVRGRLHAGLVADPAAAARVEARVRAHLAELAGRFSELVANPRAAGFAVAFDLPDPATLQAYLGQRFWRGAVGFAAGDRTVRYRLSAAFGAREIDLLFDAARRSLSWIDAHPGRQPPPWEDVEPPAAAGAGAAAAGRTRVRMAGAGERDRLLAGIVALEQRIFPPALQDPVERLRLAFDEPDGIAVVAEARREDGWQVAGYALGAPLERFAGVDGPDRDPMLGRDNTCYSAALGIDPSLRGHGLGRALKRLQLAAARDLRTPGGGHRYRFVTSRNRVGHTGAMGALNRSFGGHVVAVLTGQYGEPDGRAAYLRVPLRPVRAEAPGAGAARPGGEPPGADCASGLARPLEQPPPSLEAAEAAGLLYGPVVNKLTLSNYATPATVRAVEWVAALVPDLPHLYLTSSRDETVDKALRLLRWHRRQASVVIGLAGGYVGHTSAAARSISDPGVLRGLRGHFDWPRVAHPADAGPDGAVAALREGIDRAGGAAQVLAVVLEPVQERTGRVVPPETWPLLERLREDTGVPVVLVETATACYRTGAGPFASSGSGFRPDLLAWWGGGQVGFVHAGGAHFVGDPLTMVSTWDGDELSLVRVHHQLRAARRLDLGAPVEALDAALEVARGAGLTVRGRGLYRVLEAGERAGPLHAALRRRGARLRHDAPGHLAIVPPLDAADRAAARLRQALEPALAEVR